MRIAWASGFAAALALALGFGASGSEPGSAPRPDVVVILSDDVGYSDLGCYGGEILTPRLDALAAGGLRFSQFYNTGRCCPTRASLLTGLYPHQAGVGHMMEDRGVDGYRGNLDPRCPTIAEALKPSGYGTYAVGKWHVTRDYGPEGDKRNWPLQRGFDRYYGTIVGGGNFYDPAGLVRDNRMMTIHTDPEYPAEGYYYTNAIGDHAARFVRDHARERGEAPLFLYVAFTAGHWPMHAPEADVAKVRGRYDAGYEPIRRARLARLRELGLIPADGPVAPTVGDWEGFEAKEWEARCMEVYAAMLESMDRNIGKVVDALRETGRLDNALILYLQDNGGCAETVGRVDEGNGERADRPTLPVISPDAISTSSRPEQTREGYPMRKGPKAMPGPEDTFIAYGENWANVSNTPFRLYKHYVHEGGIATPLIAHWPAGITAEAGSVVRDPGHLVDILPTCLELAGASHPATRGGRPTIPPEGVSLAKAFRGEPLGRDRPLYWEHEGNRAIRDGDWKLVALEDGPWELYDLSRDRAESRNLVAENPRLVERLAREWKIWADRTGVSPLGAWRGLEADGAPKRPGAQAKKKAQGKTKKAGAASKGAAPPR